MKNYKQGLMFLGVTAICCLLMLPAGCKKETEQPVPEEKPTMTVQVADFVNVRCPMMDTDLDLTKVPEDLTRVYKNQKVAFCCAGCPAAWDKLSDTEKDAKLAKVMRPEE